MIDDIRNQLAGRGFRLHPRDELAAGRADHLDLDLGKALVEFPDDFLLDLGEVRGVETHLPLALGGRDQLRRAEILSACTGRLPNARPKHTPAIAAKYFP